MEEPGFLSLLAITFALSPRDPVSRIKNPLYEADNALSWSSVPTDGTFFWVAALSCLTHQPGGVPVSKSQIVARHLPFLRRYARALTGSQSSGDAYVTAVLEALLEDPDSLPESEDPRVNLYRTFTKIWNSVPLNGATNDGGDQLPAEARIGRLTPLPRQAFLLISLEGFGEEEAAKVLDVDVKKLRKMLDEAGQELAGEIATDVLIIEDEPLIAMDIEGLVERLGHKVLGVARTHKEAVKLASSKRPGLILADIQLADGSSGLEAVNEPLQSFNVPVIFITAYPERFLTGERPEPAFLIPKPYQPATISAVISQALFFERKAQKPAARATA
jgi:DNA-directed RNA polymerase specialized sigma24 family protein/CheY-like chemotaxis protein